MKKLLLASSLALGFASGLFADNIAITSVSGGGASGSTFVNFDGFTTDNSTQWATGVQVSFGGTASAVQGSALNQYAAPFLSGNNGVGFGSPDQADGEDQTVYLSAGTGSLTFDFTVDQKYLGLLWGSVDDYNTLSFYNDGNLLASFTGLDVTAFANGDQGASGTFYVSFNNLDGVFDQVVATSSINSFEIDNLAFDTKNRVPDSGATIALLGLGLIGLASLRRKF